MAVYSGLHQLAESVVGHLKTLGGAFLTNTHYGQPPETPTASTDGARVTMLWLTPQPTHRNDAQFRNHAGVLEPAPVTLSVYLMITTYGPADDPATAYQMLGQVVRSFHETPVLTLPISGVGQGELTMALVPTAADLMEKVFSPIQIKHRPFVIYEAGPVQLVPLVAPTTGAPPVKPGGIGLDVVVRPSPAIVRITPERQVPGGAVRLDLQLGGSPLGEVTVDGTTVASVPVPGTAAVRVLLPGAVAGGVAPLAVRIDPAPGRWSDPAPIAVLPTSAASVDAPTVDTTALGSPLVLAGRGLAGATAVFLWPDEGTPGDTDVREITLGAPNPSATALTLSGAALSSAINASPGRRSLVSLPVRVVVRLATGGFTPYVLMRFVP